jgi:hypothetical protein
VTESSAAAHASSAVGQAYLQYVGMPPLAALLALANATRTGNELDNPVLRTEGRVTTRPDPGRRRMSLRR